jgi:predicted nucleotidyltransferase
MNSNDDYVRSIVARHAPQVIFVAQQKINELSPHIHAWANGHAYEIKLSGSLAKGTCIAGSSDIDIFISLHPSVKDNPINTLEYIYNTLRNRLNGAGYTAREQNVSLGINHTGLKVDLVAGVKHHPLGLDHSIWKRKKGTWTKTNIDEHINYVSQSGRVEDIKAVKIWKKLRALDFPSFYLELSVIEALSGKPFNGSPADNFATVMRYLQDDFKDKVMLDPSNQANEVSEELSLAEKGIISGAAQLTLQGNWNQAIW